MFLLKESTTREDLEDYLDHLFKVITPGKRFIASIGDTTPAGADFDRLLLIADRFEKEGRLPLEAGAVRPVSDAQLKEAAERVRPSFISDDEYKTIQEDVLKGDEKKVVGDVKKMLDDGAGASDILNRGMLSAMEIIGDRFKDGSVFIPEVLLSARAMNEALKVLEPYLAESHKSKSGKVLIGTAYGDLHDIGKNMVVTMLKGVGFDVVDLGVNVKVEDFVRRVSEEKPDVLGISALLTTTMTQMKKVIDALTEAGLRQKVKVIVGGAPVNQKFADDIHADGYGHDAGAAVALVKGLISS